MKGAHAIASICMTCRKPINDGSCLGVPDIGFWHRTCEPPENVKNSAWQHGVAVAWFHNCPREGMHFVGIGQPCNWCGGTEAQEPDPDPVKVEQLVRKTYGGK